MLVGYLVERSEADLAAPLLGLVAGRSRRGSHDHEKQEHPETGELVAAWKIKKGKVKRKEKGKEAYGWMDGYLTSATTRVRARDWMREKGGKGGSSLLTKRKAAKRAQEATYGGGKGWEEVNDGEE